MLLRRCVCNNDATATGPTNIKNHHHHDQARIERDHLDVQFSFSPVWAIMTCLLSAFVLYYLFVHPALWSFPRVMGIDTVKYQQFFRMAPWCLFSQRHCGAQRDRKIGPRHKSNPLLYVNFPLYHVNTWTITKSPTFTVEPLRILLVPIAGETCILCRSLWQDLYHHLAHNSSPQ